MQALGGIPTHPSDKNRDVARVGHPVDTQAVPHPSDKNRDVARVGYPVDTQAVYHPSDKNRDVARVGHPDCPITEMFQAFGAITAEGILNRLP